MVLIDRMNGLCLWAKAFVILGIICSAPVHAETTPEGTTAQTCNFGETVITVGDVTTAAHLSDTEEGQELIDAANITVTSPVPEPGTLIIVGAELIALYLLRRKVIQGQV